MLWSRRSVLRLFMAILVGEALYVSLIVRPAIYFYFHFHFTFLLFVLIAVLRRIIDTLTHLNCGIH